jgi:hypothetical protein
MVFVLVWRCEGMIVGHTSTLASDPAEVVSGRFANGKHKLVR